MVAKLNQLTEVDLKIAYKHKNSVKELMRNGREVTQKLSKNGGEQQENQYLKSRMKNLSKMKSAVLRKC